MDLLIANLLTSYCFHVQYIYFHIKPMTSKLQAVLSADELEAILMRGHECEKSECSLDDVNSLIVELQEQQQKLYERVQSIDNMIKSLETMNHSKDRNVDEVRDTLRAIFRIFAMSPRASGNDYPALSRPTGYAGEVGKGPTDAYKALDPKPWKNKSP
jgi:hypothetical protein